MTDKKKKYMKNAASMADLSQIENWEISSNNVAVFLPTFVNRTVNIEKINSLNDILRIIKATKMRINISASKEDMEKIEDLLLPEKT